MLSEDASSTITLIAMNLAFSDVNVVINTLLCFIMPIITHLEHLGTKTSYDSSVAFKLTIALILNSGVLPIIVYKKEMYFTDGGFLMSVWMNWLCICILSPILELFNVGYLLKMIQWALIRSKKSKSILTQREANIELEPYEISMISKYSETINIMLYTAFYLLLFPPGILITLAGLFIQYWVTKV